MTVALWMEEALEERVDALFAGARMELIPVTHESDGLKSAEIREVQRGAELHINPS